MSDVEEILTCMSGVCVIGDLCRGGGGGGGYV